MNTRPRSLALAFRPLTALTIGVAILSVGYAQNAGWNRNPSNRPGAQPRAAAQPMTTLQPVTAQSEGFTLSQLAGRPLRSPTQEELGAVTDFLIDPQSGKVRFAVVPSGGGAAGETFRLVPIEAMDPNAGAEAFTARIDRAKWDQVGTREAARMQARVSLGRDEMQRMSDQFALGQNAGFNENRGALELVRATSLREQPIRSGNDQLGTISDVAIDIRHQAAAAVFAPSASFGSAQKLFVPVNRLQFSGEPHADITTTLTRNDFQQSLSSLTPTGYGPNPNASAPFIPAMQPPVTAAAAAVQQAFAQNRSLAGAGVEVVPESRLILRGSVANQQLKTQAERAAAQAAPGVRIESQLTVQGW